MIVRDSVADMAIMTRRLRTDHLDLVQVHMSPAKATLEENHTVETLKDLQAEGKVRFIGMSGILPNLPDHLAMGVFDVFQIPYSAVQRDHEELITEAADAGAGTFIRGGAARGAAARAAAGRRGRGLAAGRPRAGGHREAAAGLTRALPAIPVPVSRPGIKSRN